MNSSLSAMLQETNDKGGQPHPKFPENPIKRAARLHHEASRERARRFVNAPTLGHMFAVLSGGALIACAALAFTGAGFTAYYAPAAPRICPTVTIDLPANRTIKRKTYTDRILPEIGQSYGAGR